MPLFNLVLNIPQEYKTIVNKYIEILSIAIIYIILTETESGSKSSVLDQIIYISLGYTFHYLIVKKLVRVT